jgi:hypothetical protein
MSSRTKETPSVDNLLGLQYYHKIGQLAPTDFTPPMLEWLKLIKELPQLSDVELHEFMKFMIFLQNQLNQKYEEGSFLHKIYQVDPQTIVREIGVSSATIQNVILFMLNKLKQTTELEFTTDYQIGINRFLSEQIALLKHVLQLQ